MTDRDRLIELIKQKQNGGWRFITGEYTTDVSNEYLADYLLANGVIVPPCKVGDYVIWNNGFNYSKNRLYEVKGFYYNSADLGLRYILEIGKPTINHSGIVGILTKEEAEEKLKERE